MYKHQNEFLRGAYVLTEGFRSVSEACGCTALCCGYVAIIINYLIKFYGEIKSSPATLDHRNSFQFHFPQKEPNLIQGNVLKVNQLDLAASGITLYIVRTEKCAWKEDEIHLES